MNINNEMKRVLISLTAAASLCLFSVAATIEENSNYFLGKWKVMVTGTPNGDAALLVTLEQKEDKLSGFIETNDPSTPTIQISKVEEQDQSVIIYYTASGYDVYMSMVKVDTDKVKGKLMGTYELSGERVRE